MHFLEILLSWPLFTISDALVERRLKPRGPIGSILGGGAVSVNPFKLSHLRYAEEGHQQ